MNETQVRHTQFMINQLRMKNVQKALEFLGVIVMVIFTTSLLPSLLVRYVYNDPNMLTTPPIFEVIPVFSFVLGALMFIYVVVGNVMRELRAMKLEKGLMSELMGSTSMGMSTATASVDDDVAELQAAMKSLERAETKRKPKTVAARKESAKLVKTRRIAKRKSK